MRLQKVSIILSVLLLAGTLAVAGCVSSDDLTKATDGLTKATENLTKATEDLSKVTDTLTKTSTTGATTTGVTTTRATNTGATNTGATNTGATNTGATNTGAKIGNKVSVYYTLVVDGEQLESNFDSGNPLSFTIGAGEMITGFDNGVIGMNPGETKTITVSPKDGYGVYSTDNAQTMTLSEAETALEKTLSVGDELSLNFGQYTGKVISIDRNKDTMTLSVNHHLAGKTLVFTVKLLEIK